MYKMAVVGDKDSILAFKALGLITEIAYDGETAAKVIARLAKGDCAVIFITEALAAQIPETLQRYQSSLMPALIPIPSNEGATGFGMEQLARNMERAVGMNIFMNEEGE
jgi:V/A-type H+-transporting ATPase subunit F